MSRSSSSVTAVFQDGVETYRARQMVQERLTSLSFPPGVAPPELGPITGGLGEIFHFTLDSPRRSPSELLEIAQFRVAPMLRSVAGVVEVNTWGGDQRVLEVKGKAATVYGLTGPGGKQILAEDGCGNVVELFENAKH